MALFGYWCDLWLKCDVVLGRGRRRRTRNWRIESEAEGRLRLGWRRQHGVVRLSVFSVDEMRSCFGPRKTRKDAELRGTVRGRVLLEAGGAEAAWRCPGLGAICG
jgi:hypothetical protein